MATKMVFEVSHRLDPYSIVDLGHNMVAIAFENLMDSLYQGVAVFWYSNAYLVVDNMDRIHLARKASSFSLDTTGAVEVSNREAYDLNT